MGLEQAPHTLVIQLLSRRQGSHYLRRMVSVVVHHGKSVDAAHYVETPLGPLERQKSVLYYVQISYAQSERRGDGSKAVCNVVLAGNGERYPVYEAFSGVQVIRGMAHGVERDVLGVEVAALAEAKGLYAAVQIRGGRLYEGVGVVSDYGAVLGYRQSELAERAGYVVYVLKVIQMVRIYVEYYLHPGAQLQEAVHVLAGLGDEVILAAYADVSVELVEYAADGYGRILARILQDERYHGRGGSLAVGAGHRYGVGVFRKQHPQSLGSGYYRDAHLLSLEYLRVLHRYRVGVDQQVRTFRVLCVVADVYGYPLSAQVIRYGALLHVGAGDFRSAVLHYLGYGGDAYASDPQEMNVFIVLKIHGVTDPAAPLRAPSCLPFV